MPELSLHLICTSRFLALAFVGFALRSEQAAPGGLDRRSTRRRGRRKGNKSLEECFICMWRVYQVFVLLFNFHPLVVLHLLHKPLLRLAILLSHFRHFVKFLQLKQLGSLELQDIHYPSLFNTNVSLIH